jgi:phage tail protein X
MTSPDRPSPDLKVDSPAPEDLFGLIAALNVANQNNEEYLKQIRLLIEQKDEVQKKVDDLRQELFAARSQGNGGESGPQETADATADLARLCRNLAREAELLKDANRGLAADNDALRGDLFAQLRDIARRKDAAKYLADAQLVPVVETLYAAIRELQESGPPVPVVDDIARGWGGGSQRDLKTEEEEEEEELKVTVSQES